MKWPSKRCFNVRESFEYSLNMSDGKCWIWVLVWRGGLRSRFVNDEVPSLLPFELPHLVGRQRDAPEAEWQELKELDAGIATCNPYNCIHIHTNNCEKGNIWAEADFEKLVKHDWLNLYTSLWGVLIEAFKINCKFSFQIWIISSTFMC